jgi:hypothetical protein
MKEDRVADLTIDLHKRLAQVLKEFWLSNEEECKNPHSLFVVNSSVITSLIADITFFMFNKDGSIKVHLEYIDDLADRAKETLKEYHHNLRSLKNKQ